MFRKITVATDGSPLAEKAVGVAAGLASKCDAELTVVHVLMHGEAPEAIRRMAQIEHLIEEKPRQKTAVEDTPVQMIRGVIQLDEDATDQQILMIMGESIVTQAKNKAEEVGVANVKTEILSGEYADEIVTAAKRNGSDLVVLGTQGHGVIEGTLMGSVSQKVAHDVGCACMIVK